MSVMLAVVVVVLENCTTYSYDVANEPTTVTYGRPALHSQAHHLSVCRRLP